MRLAASLAALLLVAAPTGAQTGSPAATAPVADPVDLSGLWVISNRTPRGFLDEKLAPLKDEQFLNAAGEAALAKVRPALDPSAMCLPAMPRHLGGPYPIEIVQRPGRVVMLFEWDTIFRLIYTDGRAHPSPEDDQRWLGHAIGRWEGDTLVVDTGNFNGKTWLEGRGLPLSAKAHLVERYRLIDGGKTLEGILKVEDPTYLLRPIYRKYVFNLKPDWALREYLCAEGNRDNAFAQKPGQPGSIGVNDVLGTDPR